MLIYRSADGSIKIDVRMGEETVWLTQDQMAALFGKAKSTINEHLKNICSEGELVADSVIRNFRTTAADGKSYDTNYYNLDVIISVGYRVKSHQGTQFRIWATQVLREYLIKGFALNDERMKSGKSMNYFDELQERITSLIYDDVKSGRDGDPQKFAAIHRDLVAQGCDCGVLACTELSVFADKHHLPPFYTDAMAVLAERAVQACHKPLRTIFIK